MDVWKRCRTPVLAALASVGVVVAGAGIVRAEPLVVTLPSLLKRTAPDFQVASHTVPSRPALDLGRLARQLQAYTQEVGAELASDFAIASLTMIGGHGAPPTPPPPTPPRPPITNTSPPPPPPPPTPTTPSTPPPVPPPPTTQGGPPPTATPEPASIVTGLLGLTVAGAAGWYKRRKQ